jgi:cell division protein FtsI (penicillin-binding protein 3)
MSTVRRKNIREIITERFTIFIMFIFALFVLLMFFLWRVIMVKGPELREEAAQTYIKERSVEATRGNIYSSDGSLLATSLPKYKMGLDPTVYGRSKTSKQKYDEQIDALCAALANFFQDRTADEYKNRIESARKSGKNYLLINNRLLDFQEKKKVLTFPLFREFKGDATKTGVVFDKVNVRYAPFGQMAYRTIGYLKDKLAVGLEGSFDKELRGIPGVGLFEKMDKNTWRPVDGGKETIPTPGYDLQTTLDVNIQDIVEVALMKALSQYKGKYAVAIVMETATGEIKAISNLSKNEKSATGYLEADNHAITTPNDPGSVFKLASMMALLEESDLRLDEIIHVGPRVSNYFGRPMSDSHEMGDASVQKIIEASSNNGVMKLMWRTFSNKQSKFYNYLRKFHLIDPINFQITSRNPKPNFPVPSKWDKYQLLWSSVGYSSSYTPIQLLSFYNAIANNGYWIQPIIVKKATVGEEIKIDYTETQVRDAEPLCSNKTLTKIKTLLEGVVERGTGNNIKGTPYGIAGKTGTAQRIVNKTYVKGTYYTSFIGYFPSKRPKYTMLVAMDDPQGNSEETYSRQVTAPVFREIADNIYARDMKLQKRITNTIPDSLNQANLFHFLHPNDHEILSANFGLPKIEEDGRWIQFSLTKKKVQNFPVSFVAKTVPNVIGMTLRDALFNLENRGFKVRASGYGRVASQSIPAGSPSQKNSTIELTLKK